MKIAWVEWVEIRKIQQNKSFFVSVSIYCANDEKS